MVEFSATFQPIGMDIIGATFTQAAAADGQDALAAKFMGMAGSNGIQFDMRFSSMLTNDEEAWLVNFMNSTFGFYPVGADIKSTAAAYVSKYQLMKNQAVVTDPSTLLLADLQKLAVVNGISGKYSSIVFTPGEVVKEIGAEVDDKGK